MIHLTSDQINDLNKEALKILVTSLYYHVDSIQSQLDSANAMLADNNRQIELLTEVIISSYKRSKRKGFPYNRKVCKCSSYRTPVTHLQDKRHQPFIEQPIQLGYQKR